MQSHRKEREDMEKKTKYYVVREKAVPEVLLKVVEAKRILDSERATTVQEATEQVGISRSSFYKYKDDIFPFHDQAKGRTVTFILQMDDKPGILSDILRTVAEFRGNILTIHQSIPINGIATLTLSVEILPEAGDAEDMIGQMEQQTGVHYLKILGCVYLAIGMFLSSLTESQIIAAVITFGVLLLIYLWGGLIDFLPTSATSGMIGIVVFVTIAALIIYRMTGNWMIAGIIEAIGVVACL